MSIPSTFKCEECGCEDCTNPRYAEDLPPDKGYFDVDCYECGNIMYGIRSYQIIDNLAEASYFGAEFGGHATQKEIRDHWEGCQRFLDPIREPGQALTTEVLSAFSTLYDQYMRENPMVGTARERKEYFANRKKTWV